MVFRALVFFLLLSLLACTGSSELETDYQIVLGINNPPNPTGVLAGCINLPATTGGLLKIDSRRLGGSNPSGKCEFAQTDSPPFDLERSFNVSATGSLFVSLPKANLVQAYDSKLTVSPLWKYPDTVKNVILPPNHTEFCPTQLTLSSSEVTATNNPSESLLFILDDPTQCQSNRTEARVTALNRDGTRKGWLELGFANRNSGQIRLAASSTELFILYADFGASYKVARLLLSNLIENTPASSLQFSEPIPNVLSASNTKLTLEFAQTNTNAVGLWVGVGGSGGVLLPVTFNTTSNKPEFGAALREGGENSDFVGATSAIFWNRDSAQKPVSIFARERPDILLRRVQNGVAQVQTRILTTTDGIFTPDGFFWGLHNNTLYRLDVFNFPNLQLTQNPNPLSNAETSSISWLIGN